MGSAKRQRFRDLELRYGPSTLRPSRPRTMRRCMKCYGRGKERQVGVFQVRVVKCGECGGKGRVPTGG